MGTEMQKGSCHVSPSQALECEWGCPPSVGGLPVLKHVSSLHISGLICKHENVHTIFWNLDILQCMSNVDDGTDWEKPKKYFLLAIAKLNNCLLTDKISNSNFLKVALNQQKY